MIRIYGDFNNMDEQDRLLLHCIGSMADIEKHKAQLHEGLRVKLYSGDLDFEVEGLLIFDIVWRAEIDWSTLLYL